MTWRLWLDALLCLVLGLAVCTLGAYFLAVIAATSPAGLPR